VQRDPRGDPDKFEHRLAVLDFLENVPWLAREPESPEPRSAGAHSPGWYGHTELLGSADERLKIDVPALQLPGKMIAFVPKLRRADIVVVLDGFVCDRKPHVRQRKVVREPVRLYAGD
jgi:hypothetical protein